MALLRLLCSPMTFPQDEKMKVNSLGMFHKMSMAVLLEWTPRGVGCLPTLADVNLCCIHYVLYEKWDLKYFERKS